MMSTALNSGIRAKRSPLRGGIPGVVLLAVLLILLPTLAEACSATGLFTLGGGTKKCDPAQTGIFATVLCLFENTLESMLGTTYCAFQASLQGPLAAVFGLFIAGFGIGVLAGYIRMSFRDAVITVAKLGLVMVFAVNSDYAIQMTGKLAMGLLQQGTGFVLGPLGGSSSLTQPDSMIAGMFNFMSNPNLANLNVTNNCGGQPCVNDSILRIISNCAAWLAVMAIGLIVFLPVVIVFIFMLIVQFLALFVRSLLSYVVSVVIITFLLVLSPIFVSFALFNVTSQLFTQWLQYLKTFSIQSIVLFAFLAMLGVATQGFTSFFYGVLKLLRPLDTTYNFMLWTVPITSCGICEYEITMTQTTSVINYTTLGGMQSIRCQPAVDISTVVPGPVVTHQLAVTPDSFPPRTATGGVTGGKNSTAVMPNAISGGTPITYDLTMGAVLSSQQNNMSFDPSQHNGYNYVIPLTSLITKADFIMYVAMNVIAFAIIATLFQEFISRSPEIARKLGGASSAGGFGGSTDFMGGNIALGGMQSVDRAIKGMEKEMYRNPFSNVDGNIFKRFKDGFFGRSTVDRKDFKTNEGFLEAKKGEIIAGGALGALMHGAARDQDEGEKGYALKVAQRRVDDAAYKLQGSREATEAAARELTDSLNALDALDPQRKRASSYGSSGALADAYKRLAKAQAKYEQEFTKSSKLQDSLTSMKQELRDAEFDYRQTMQGGLMSAGGRVTEARTAGAAALLGASPTLRRAQKKIEEEDKKRPDFKKHFADPNMVALSSTQGRKPAGTTGRGSNSSEQLISAQDEASQRLKEIEKQMGMYGRFMKDDARKQNAKVLEDAKLALGRARTEQEVYEATKGLKGVESTLERYSSRSIMEGAALAGVAAMGAYMMKASGIVPAAYLDDVKKLLDGADKEIRKGEAQAAEVAKGVEAAPRKVTEAVVHGAQNSADLAARIVPESSLQKTRAATAKAEEELKSAKDPADYFRILTSLEGQPMTQLQEVFAGLSMQRAVATATVEGALTTPRDWDKATYDNKRKYLEGVLTQTGEEMASTSGMRKDEENAALKAEMEGIRKDMATASTEEEFNRLLKRTGELRRSTSSSSNMFAMFDQTVSQAQAASSTARSGNEHQAVLGSLLSAPGQLGTSVIGALAQHTRGNHLISESERAKRETELAQATLNARRAVTGNDHESILESLGRTFIGGDSSAVIAMNQWEATPDDQKRETAEKMLAETRESYDRIKASLSAKDRKEYEQELSKASAALAAADSRKGMRDAVAQTVAIKSVLRKSEEEVAAQQRQEEARKTARAAQKDRDKRALDVGVTAGELNLGSHVMRTVTHWDKTEDREKAEYTKDLIERTEATLKKASAHSLLSEEDRKKYEEELEKIKSYYTQSQSVDEMRSVVAKAAALEGRLLSDAEEAERLDRIAREKKEEDEEEQDSSAPDPSASTPISTYLPALGQGVLTGNGGPGFMMYLTQTLRSYDGLDNKRRAEYVMAFIDKSKKDVDAQKTLTDQEKAEHKKKLDTIAASVATETTPEGLRGKLSQSLAVMGAINAVKPETSERPQVTSAPAASGDDGPAPAGKIEVAGRTYDTAEYYDRLEDAEKERVQKILSRNPEMTLQDAIAKMNDEDATRIKKGKNKKKEEGWDVWADDKESDESKSGGGKVGLATGQASRQQADQKAASDAKKKKNRDNLSMGQWQKIIEMMKKHPGMTVEKAVMMLNVRGKIY